MSIKYRVGVMPGPWPTGPAGADLLWRFIDACETSEIDSLWFSERLSSPLPVLEPMTTMAAVAARTRRLKFGPSVLVTPFRSPVVMARELAMLDYMSGGRILLGIGVGWLEEEFNALGVPFHERGPRTDEYILAMRELWAAEKPTFKGKFVQFKDAYCRPQPVNKAVPIIVGGHSEAAAKRAGKLGDGFFPARDAPADMIALARKTAAAAGRDPNKLEITVSMPEDLERLAALKQLGVSRVLVPATPMAGLKQMVRGPEDVLKFKATIERYAAL